MSTNHCPQCGAPVAQGDTECRYCGEQFSFNTGNTDNYQQQYYQQQNYYQPPQQPQQSQQSYVQNVYAQQSYNGGINPEWYVKNKIIAGILAILLGNFGIHKFYLGEIRMGILYLIFFWTGIPAIVGVIEGIIYLVQAIIAFRS